MDNSIDNSLNSLILRIEVLEHKNKELTNSINGIISRSFKDKKTTEEGFSVVTTSLKEYKDIVELLQTSDKNSTVLEQIQDLDTKLNSLTLRRGDLLKSLSKDGDINLKYNLALTPRVLPKNPKNNILVLDVRDGKLKLYYNKEWRILNGK